MSRICQADVERVRALVTAGLQPVGDEVEVSQSLIDRFAATTNDFNPMHHAEESLSGPFRRPVAHGFFSVANVPHLAHRLNPFQLIPNAWCLLKRAEMDFHYPVPVGKKIHCLGRIADIDLLDNPANVASVRFEWQVNVGSKKSTTGVFILYYFFS